MEQVTSYDPDADEALLNRAYVYAMKAHGSQKRASGDPYFSHPLAVAAILIDLKLDDATIAAALLHDTIEDTEATKQEIDQLFGHEIASLVDGLTKLKRLDLVTKEAAQAENLRKFLLAISDDIRVLLCRCLGVDQIPDPLLQLDLCFAVYLATVLVLLRIPARLEGAN